MNDSQIERKYDRMILSNVVQYLDDNLPDKTKNPYQFLRENMDIWTSYLNDDGILQLLYLYAYSKESLKNNSNSVSTYNLCSVINSLDKYPLEISFFDNFLGGGNRQDAIVTYQKTKKWFYMKDIIVIVGPTGIGKTKLSISLAKIYNAEIINGDSVSIYKKLNIGSAKPTVEEMNSVIHHLIDIKNIDEDYSIFDYQKDVRQKIDEITKRGKRVIIVGGSGLYLKAALYDYKFDSNTSNNSYEDLTNEEILSKINSINSDIDIHINNRKRLVRTLNKLESNEEETYNKDVCLYPLKIIGLTTSRDVLYDRINKRVDSMINDGLIEEIISLKENYNNSRVLNTAIGYKEFYDYLFNNKTLDEVIIEIKKNSRHFAKRQYTFFNHQMDVKWFSADFDNFQNTINEVNEYIQK